VHLVDEPSLQVLANDGDAAADTDAAGAGRRAGTASTAVGVALTWYQATRHSFVSRSLRNGASLDEVSAAVGHSSPVVTRMYYDHYIRRTFSPSLRQGIGGAPKNAKVEGGSESGR
jgi:hypothetical protein